MEEQILEQAARAAERAEVYYTTGAATAVVFQANRCHALETRQTRGAGLRLIREGRVGFASSTMAGGSAASDLVRTAVEATRAGDPAGFDFPGPQPLPRPKTHNNRLLLLPNDAMLRACWDVLEYAVEEVPDMKVDLTLRRNYTLTRLLNTQGIDALYERTTYTLDFAGLIVTDSGLVSLSDFRNLSSGAELDVSGFVRAVVDRARPAHQLSPLTAGRHPCIFMPGAAVDLLRCLSEGSDGRNLLRQTSPFVKREGERLLDEKLTVWDDSLRDYGLASAPCDGEGLPGRRMAIIENGVFRNFLLDLRTAAATLRKSTASARRDDCEPPSPGPSNLVVAPGKMVLSRAISEMREGLIVYSTAGARGHDALSGEFALAAGLALKVENGAVTGRVKDVMLVGNFYETGREIAGIGDTLSDWGRWSVPPLHFPAVRVATRT